MSKIRPSGGYRDLRSFQTATIIYDATYWFCERFFDQRSRMSDQMVQAARLVERNRHKNHPADPTDRIPPCPKCGKLMVLRTARKSANIGN